MEIHQLEYAIAVSKNRSFARAALELSLTPPALSQQVKKLEDELGVMLFDRTTRTVTPTPAGIEFIRLAQNVVSILFDIKASMNNYLGAETGSISLGVFPAVGPYGLISLLAMFKRAFPQINVAIHEAECLDLHVMLERGEVDAIFSSYTDRAGRLKMAIDSHPLVYDNLVLVTSKSHPFADRKSVMLREAAAEDFIMPFSSSGVYEDMLVACTAEGFTPNMKYHSASTDTRFGMVAEGIGISFASSKVAGSYVMHDIAVVRFTPVVRRTLNFVLPKDRVMSPAMMNFRNFSLRWAEARAELLS